MQLCYIGCMNKLITILVALATAITGWSQTQFEAFNRDNDLNNSLKTFDFSSFIDQEVTFTFDTLERKTDAAGLMVLMKQFVVVDKKAILKKAAETNNGYLQTFGVYKNDIATLFIRFEFDPESMKLKEVFLEKN